MDMQGKELKDALRDADLELRNIRDEASRRIDIGAMEPNDGGLCTERDGALRAMTYDDIKEALIADGWRECNIFESNASFAAWKRFVHLPRCELNRDKKGNQIVAYLWRPIMANDGTTTLDTACELTIFGTTQSGHAVRFVSSVRHPIPDGIGDAIEVLSAAWRAAHQAGRSGV